MLTPMGGLCLYKVWDKFNILHSKLIMLWSDGGYNLGDAMFKFNPPLIN